MFVVCSNVFIGAGILSLTMQSSVCDVGGLRLKAEPLAAIRYFSVFEAFSFLLDDGLARLGFGQHTMKALH